MNSHRSQPANPDSKPTARSPAEYAASAFLLLNIPPAERNLYPPDVLAEAEKCADPQGYLRAWLKLERTTMEIQVLRGKLYPPDVLAQAEKCTDPQRYLRNWLELEKSKGTFKSSTQSSFWRIGKT